MRRRAAAAAAAALSLLVTSPALADGGPSCPRTASPLASVPTWKATIGYPLGAHAATPEQIDRYLRVVDRASGRVRTFLAGRSVDGRPLRYAAVSTPAHLARLNTTAAEMRGLRDGAITGRRAAAIAATRPAFAWIGGSVHGGEPSGGDADMRLLYELASGRTCSDQARLQRLVVFLLPLQNPDGRAAGDRYNAAGFDLNRDWFAGTQPETRAKLAALTRFPPLVFADQHEEGGTGFFFPPNADPVHHEVPSAALHAIDGVIAPRLRRAFRAHHVDFVNYDTYDLFFMGYGDTVPTTEFGAAGMTFEKGADSPYPDKTAEHFLAADQTLRAAAADRRGLLARWAGIWRQAQTQGAAGMLQPNRVVQPDNTVRFPVPSGRVFGYLIKADAHPADAAALVARLQGAGVRVRRLTATGFAAGYHDYHGPSIAGQVEAGTYYVPLAQPAKHWVEAMLGEDPYVPFPYFYDVSSWSNPLLMGLDGGWVDQPLTLTTQPVPAHDHAATPEAPLGYFAQAGSEAAAELAYAGLRAGIDVRRLSNGHFGLVGAPGTIARLAAAHHVPLEPLTDGLLHDSQPLRTPAVGMLRDSAGNESGAWTRWLLARRYGLAVPALTASDITGGALAKLDALVVAEGSSSPSDLPPTALVALQAWVRGGGTLIGVGGRGLGVARAAGVTAVRATPPPAGFQIPGVAIAVEIQPDDLVTAGEEHTGWVFNDGDPILDAGSARAVVRYFDGQLVRVSGYATGTDALRGTAAVTTETTGAGRVVIFASDPAFRGYTDGTERLLGNALLGATATRSAARSAPRARTGAPRLVDPAALALPSPERDATVRVAAEDEAGLLAAARAAGVPAGATLERDLTTVTLRVPDAAAIDGPQPAWTRRMPDALRAAGVVPLLAVL